MINTIIFDFDNVFMDMNRHNTVEELKKLGLKEWNEDFEAVVQKLEKGKLTEVQFMIEVKKLIPNIQIEDFREAWYAQLGEFPLNRLEFLQKLAHKYEMYLIGNFDEILFAKFEHKVGGTFAREFYQCFKGVYFSHEIGSRKPDIDAIKFVVKRHGVSLKRTLYVDDSLENINIAKEIGFETWYLDPKKEDVTNLLQANDIILKRT